MIKNNKGQGLSEYIILVSLLAIASLGIVRILGKTIQSQLTNITYGIQGVKKEIKTENIRIDSSLYKKKDMGNFLEGAASDNKK